MQILANVELHQHAVIHLESDFTVFSPESVGFLFALCLIELSGVFILFEFLLFL